MDLKDSLIDFKHPDDSGLSLMDEPLDLGGSAFESIELPDDDEMVDQSAQDTRTDLDRVMRWKN
jgi:hypothetical protein